LSPSLRSLGKTDMENRYMLKDALLLLEQGEYLGCHYRIISYGRFPGVYIAPNVHSCYYCNVKMSEEVFNTDPMFKDKKCFFDLGGFPDQASQLNPQYTPDGNVAWWFGWAYNGIGDYQAGREVGREWTTAEMVEAAKRVIDTIVGEEQQRLILGVKKDEILDTEKDEILDVKKDNILLIEGDAKPKNKGGRPRGTGKGHTNKPTKRKPSS